MEITCHKDDSGDCCGLCQYTPVVVIATHERLEITERNIKALIGFKVVLVVSLQSELEHYKQFGITVVMASNKPLGAKWQHGVEVARKLGANPLVILGSDDFLADGYIKKALLKLKEGFDMVGLTHWITVDAVKKAAYHCQYTGVNENFPIGSGKVYSKSFLDKIRWKVFDTKADRRLDDLGQKQLISTGSKIHLFKEPYILAVKGKWVQLNPIERYLRGPNIKAEKVGSDVLSKFNYV